jgi:hypothetical protein
MAGTTVVAGLATAVWKKLSKAPVPAVAPREAGHDETSGAAQARYAERDAPGPAAGAVVLRGPVSPPERPGRLVGAAGRVPDVYLLMDEAVLRSVQYDGDVVVRSPGGGTTIEPARRWWRRTLLWMTARPDVSLALTALDPMGPGPRSATAVEPGTGLVSRSATRARAEGLDLRRLVDGVGTISEAAAEAAAGDIVRRLPAGAGGACPYRHRIVLRHLQPALVRLGVRPDRYRGLRLAETLVRSASRALDSALSGAPPCDGSNAPDPRPWPALAGDMARLRRGRLTVLSPFEFLPPDGDDARCWLDLLPAIRHVDGVAWRRPRRLPGCGPEELAALYRLTWAARRSLCA